MPAISRSWIATCSAMYSPCAVVDKRVAAHGPYPLPGLGHWPRDSGQRDVTHNVAQVSLPSCIRGTMWGAPHVHIVIVAPLFRQCAHSAAATVVADVIVLVVAVVVVVVVVATVP